MSVMETLILTACMSTSGVSHDACVKALEAGSKQTEVEQNVNRAEDRVSRKADAEARELVGDTGMSAAASLGFVVKSVAEKSATFKFPVFTPQMYLSTQIGSEKSMLGLEWKY